MSGIDSARRDALPVGSALRGYTLESVVGHGGFGIVYRAQHDELRATVAIKEYLPIELAVREGASVRVRSPADSSTYQDGLRRFRDEAQALMQFQDHPGVVSCRDFFRANGTAYMVMEFEDGRSLAEVLATREAAGRPFSEADLLGVMVPLLEGLDRVHEAGLLHRDIKPSNILIRRVDRRPVLIDFGASKQVVANQSKSMAPYTEGYAALEQVAAAGELGPWTDMYGVGAVMWRMVAGGQPPWQPPHPLRVEARSHALVGYTADPLPPAVQLGEGRFSRRVAEAIDACLHLQERRRIQSCRELLGVLRPKRTALEDSPFGPRAPLLNKFARAFNQVVLRAGRRKEDNSNGLPASALMGLGTVPPHEGADELLASGLRSWRKGEAQRRGVPSSLILDNRTLDALVEARPTDEAQLLSVPGVEAIVAKEYRARLIQIIRSAGNAQRQTRSDGSSWRNSLGMEFVGVPAGSFVMGSPEDEEFHVANERQHEVWIRQGFWLGKYEVTQGEWEEVMGTNPAYSKSCGPRCPVERVSWDNVQEYIRRVNLGELRSGYVYRLPTEAEWEYAARSGTLGPRHGELDSIAWYGANSDNRTHPGGQKQANEWGLHDMLGNVWEWTTDWYSEDPSGSVADTEGSRSGSARVVRGGCWCSIARGIRFARRGRGWPGGGIGIGFRLVRTE